MHTVGTISRSGSCIFIALLLVVRITWAFSGPNSGQWLSASKRATRRLPFRQSLHALGAKKKKGNSSSGKNGGSGGGFGAVKEKKPPTKKQRLKRLEDTYGGTTPEQIARATQARIQSQIRQQAPHVQMALQLYQQLQQWDAHVSQLSVLQQAQLDPAEMEGANRARQELDRIYKESQNHSNNNPDENVMLLSSDQDLHNLLQKFTWDASADAKAAKALAGDMNAVTKQRIEKACELVAEATNKDNNAGGGSCLDVGCGFGVLVPFLVQAGVPADKIHGVDLSPEMIRNAQELHGGNKKKGKPTFTACDFLQDSYSGPEGGFCSVIFCSSLHDLPDPVAALTKARSVLRPGGRIVIVHAQGASHVMQQVRSNPVLVKRGLPTTEELRALPNLDLVVEPIISMIPDTDEGYLAVLEKTD